MDEDFLPYRVAAHYLSSLLDASSVESPVIGVICGSGLSELSQALEGETLTVPYADIPGFPTVRVPGHKNEVVFGKLSGIPAMCFRGRFHSYEGHDMKTVVLPVNAMRCLGVKAVIVTNAAGGLNSTYQVGDVVCVSDHVAIPNLAGKNSLVGPNDDELGPRFPPTSNAYHDDFRRAALSAASELKVDFVKTTGTYCFVSGPMYESKAECHFLRSMGGDCVGMSTIPEVVAAHHCGMVVLCLSLITNKVVADGDTGPAASHAEVLAAVSKRSVQMQALVRKIIDIVVSRDLLTKLPTLPPIDTLEEAYRQHRRKTLQRFLPSLSTIVGGALCMASGAMLATSLSKKR